MLMTAGMSMLNLSKVHTKPIIFRNIYISEMICNKNVIPVYLFYHFIMKSGADKLNMVIYEGVTDNHTK